MMKKILTTILLVAALAACTRPLNRPNEAMRFCIIDNPQADVLVRDFVKEMRKGLRRHGMASAVYKGDLPASCEYTLDYSLSIGGISATPYLTTAQIELRRGKKLLGSSGYNSMSEFKPFLTLWPPDAKSKVGPMIDNLLANFKHGS